MRFICKKMRVQREDAFTSGILHDVGKVILDSMFAQFYKTVFEAVSAKRMHIFEAEESTLGIVHTKLGQELAESWGIPARLIEAIAYHHNPKIAELDCELASLVHIGDAVARNLKMGSGGDPYVPCIQTFALEQLAVTSDELIEWEEEMLQAMEKDMSFLSAIA